MTKVRTELLVEIVRPEGGVYIDRRDGEALEFDAAGDRSDHEWQAMPEDLAPVFKPLVDVERLRRRAAGKRSSRAS